jgi:hypothetical protein
VLTCACCAYVEAVVSSVQCGGGGGDMQYGEARCGTVRCGEVCVVRAPSDCTTHGAAVVQQKHKLHGHAVRPGDVAIVTVVRYAKLLELLQLLGMLHVLGLLQLIGMLALRGFVGLFGYLGC